MPREGSLHGDYARQVWNVQRYDKLKLVKSFLLTVGRRSYPRQRRTMSSSAENELLHSRREDQLGGSAFSRRDIFYSGHFEIIRLPTADG